MSGISNRGEQSTSAEIAALTNLAALAASGAGEFLRKTGLGTFENATPASGTTLSVATPTGTVDDNNTAFVFSTKPLLILINGSLYAENAGWTWAGSTATLFTPVGTGGVIRGLVVA